MILYFCCVYMIVYSIGGLHICLQLVPYPITQCHDEYCRSNALFNYVLQVLGVYWRATVIPCACSDLFVI
jgi:hypothetical protein